MILEEALAKWGIDRMIIKKIKAFTELLAVLGAGYALHIGAEPFLPMIVMLVAIGGPELLEHVIIEKHREKN
jgi:hypothetical protein